MENQKIVTLLLIRHGQAQSNVSKILTSYPEAQPMPLSEQGRIEAQEAAQEIKELRIDAIFSSPLTRTKQTAQIISDAVNVPITIEHRLRETDFGTYNNQPLSKFFLRYPHPSLRMNTSKESGVEGLIYVQERLKEFSRELQQNYLGKTVVLVTHADVIRELWGIVEETGRHPGYIATGSVKKILLKSTTKLD